MNQTLKLAALGATLAVFTAGCATYTGQTNDPNDPNRTQRGALIGAVNLVQNRARPGQFDAGARIEAGDLDEATELVYRHMDVAADQWSSDWRQRTS